jgi:hypothetical protein
MHLPQKMLIACLLFYKLHEGFDKKCYMQLKLNFHNRTTSSLQLEGMAAGSDGWYP